MILLSSILFGCFSINTNCFRNYKKIKKISINKSFYDTQKINLVSSGSYREVNLAKNNNNIEKKSKIQ